MILAEFGGYPFVDDNCRHQRLLTAVACARWARQNGAAGEPADAPPSPRELATMLAPRTAFEIRRLDLDLEMDWEPLPDAEQARVGEALDTIQRCVPAWHTLVELPVLFGWMPSGRQAISASSFAWPQHIWLSRVAFNSPPTLIEQVLHELSHQWLYLVEELAPLEDAQAGVKVNVTLPSGTPQRTISELLGALHVSVNLRRLWTVMEVPQNLRTLRLQRLLPYIDGCVDLLSQHEDSLTGEGRALADRLIQEAR